MAQGAHRSSIIKFEISIHPEEIDWQGSGSQLELIAWLSLLSVAELPMAEPPVSLTHASIFFVSTGMSYVLEVHKDTF